MFLFFSKVKTLPLSSLSQRLFSSLNKSRPSITKKMAIKQSTTIIKDENTQSDDDYNEHLSNTFISDEIHDYIEIPRSVLKIIDTPEFQRLRELKQLGATYYIFPGGSHNRFEHSLGVFHLATRLIQHLQHRQPKLKITKEEIYCVSVAGLLHDLGHGPFSHVFDHEFVPSITTKKFRHENMSIKLIKKLFKDNNIEIKPESLKLICALVSPSTHQEIVEKYKKQNRGFLFEIIANESNGVDVDKWDYFLRDSHNLSLDISFKYTRLLTHCRVIDDHICFRDKTSYDIQILFNTRYDLFKRVYSHKTSKSVEYMICDVMRFANPYFKITEKIEAAKDFMELTDNIISRIQWTPIIKYDNINNSADREMYKSLEKAQEIIKRIQTRDLYRCVGYVLLDSSTIIKQYLAINLVENNNNNNNDDDEDNDDKDDETESSQHSDLLSNTKIDYHLIENKWRKEIYKMLKKQTNNFLKCENKLECDDILCQLMSLSYGMENTHPIQNVYFYNAQTPNKADKADIDQITTMHDPSKFREVIFRLYVKDSNWRNEGEIVFKKFCEKKKLVDFGRLEKQTSLGLSPKVIKMHKSPSPKVSKSKSKSKRIGGTKRNLNDMFDDKESSPLLQEPQRKKAKVDE